MVDFLRDYQRKRDRAMFHFEVLNESTKDISERQQELVPGEFENDGEQRVFRVPVEPSDPDWAILLGDFVYNLGDCVYNLRASLDYAITALVLSAGNEENEYTEFPIFGMTPAKDITWKTVRQWWEDDRGGRVARKLRDTPSGTAPGDP